MTVVRIDVTRWLADRAERECRRLGGRFKRDHRNRVFIIYEDDGKKYCECCGEELRDHDRRLCGTCGGQRNKGVGPRDEIPWHEVR